MLGGECLVSSMGTVLQLTWDISNELTLNFVGTLASSRHVEGWCFCQNSFPAFQKMALRVPSTGRRKAGKRRGKGAAIERERPAVVHMGRECEWDGIRVTRFRFPPR